MEINAAHNPDGLHTVTLQDPSGETHTLRARWLVDATGRNRVLQKHLQLQQKVAEQKDVFWFRLANFNPEILSRIEAIKSPTAATFLTTPRIISSEKATGSGTSPCARPKTRPSSASASPTARTSIRYGEIHNMEQFLECVGREHPVLVELIQTGTVVDTNFYGSYMWECRQRYSPDRWYIIGDASDTVDPLYSVGLALSTLQIRQIAAIVQRELNGFDTTEFTKDLDTVIAAFQRGVTRDTTRLYACMGNAYQCHLGVHLAVTKLFHLALPLVMNDYLWDPLGVKLINWFSSLETLEADSKKIQELIRDVAANPKNLTLENFIKVQSGVSMNFGYYEYHREEDIAASLSRMAFHLARLRLALLRKLGWRALINFKQQRALLKDLFRGLFLVPFYGVNLRKNWLVRMKFSSRETKQARERSTSDAQLSRNLGD